MLITKRIILVSLLFFSFLTTNAQGNIDVTGIVTDQNNTPLSGVTITVSNSTTSAQTDAAGMYKISVPRTATLTFNYLGFEPQQVPVNNQAKINIQLTGSINVMDELVVIGYGTVRKRDLTGAVGSVKGDDIRNLPVTSAAQALTGRVAGVSVVTQSGAPGADINLNIRGGTSLTSETTPLYVVDGFVMDDGLTRIDVNDIESMEILKDASATAIYGSRGSNGVVLITTKSGKAGRTNVDYNTYYSFEGLSKKLDLLNVEEYVKYQYELQTLGGRQPDFATGFGGDVDAPDFASGAYARIQRDYANRKGVDWQDAVFGGQALLNVHNVNINGGNEKTKFMLSYNNTHQNGVVAKSGMSRNSVRARIDHEIIPGLNVDFNSMFQSQHVEGGRSLGGMLKMAILQPVTGGTRFTDEQLLNEDLGEELQQLNSQYDIFNPIITNDARSLNAYERVANINAGFTAKLFKDFTWRGTGSYQWWQDRNTFWDDGRTADARANLGPFGDIKNGEKYQWQVTNTVSWLKDFGKHNLNLLAGHEVMYRQNMSLKHKYFLFPSNNFGLNDVSLAGRTERAETEEGRYGIVSVFARAIYNYDNRYLFTGTLRRDGVSTFMPGRQWGNFPSASAAWNIHNEQFMENVDFFDQLKVRVGYGTTGNDKIGNVRYATLYGPTIVAINNEMATGLRPGDIVGNPLLMWEKTQTTNVAADISFFNNRVNVTADFYNNRSSNLLLEAEIPTSTGYRFQYQNVAVLRNRGVELTLGTTNIRNDHFQWRSNLNMTFNRSLTQSLTGSAGSDYLQRDVDSRAIFRTYVDQSVGKFFGYKYDGVYTTDDFIQNGDGSYTLKDGVAALKGKNRATVKPGDVKYVPTADEMDSDGNPVWSTNDRTIIGNPEPKFFGGFNNEFIYGNFDLSVFLNFSYGNQAFNMNTQRFMGPYLPNQNSLGRMADRFTLIDPATGAETMNLARLAELNPNQHDKDQVWSLNSTNSIAVSDALDYYLEDASFLRINNITLGYTLPGKVSQRAFINRLRVFVTLNNIHTFTKFSGYDPEVSATGSILTRGVDNSAYPRAKSFVAGLNLTF
ncbi:SusC/RagA family TonB-linked outer membrane protein [Sphingobacterium pedocola]|uniref:SusC/RagA family protein n=1 Tax=Sphingobacterium pedocola TaxID=2082722 RepID=A0ABR9TAA3_9SPHI|nr:TonB-dependent receptor [Sphingobacterium pedocola]MBE8722263.1 SusC/RagA family protein [Sphingobacterium pedocola]